MAEKVIIREETRSDAGNVNSLLLECFPDEPVPGLVKALRDRQQIAFALVASPESDPESVIGYIAFTAMKSPLRTLGLAPLGVHPAHRKKGVASMLIKQGIKTAVHQGYGAIVLLGSPSLYGRFGFRNDVVTHWDCSYSKQHVLGLELEDGSLSSRKGEIAFADEFAEFGL